MKTPKKMLARGALLLGCIAVLAAGTFWFAFPNEKTAPVITTKAVRADLEETVLASGTLEASKLISVGAQVSGQIKSLKVKLGEKVAKDQLVAEIDSLTQQNNLHNAEASLQDAHAQYLAEQAILKQTEAAFQRQKAMREHDAVSKESYQTAEANYESAKALLASLDAKIKEAEITVDSAKVNLGYTNITAPIDGTVVAIVTEEGQTVNSVQQAPTIIKLAQLETMTIKAKISEADITRVKIGQKVHFTILGEPDHIYEATLRAVEPAPDSIKDDTTSSSSTTTSSTSSSSTSSAIYYNGLFDVPNQDDKLRISMTAEINIILNEVKNVISIPRTALGELLPDGSSIVRVVNPVGMPEERNVRIGINNNVNVEVISGLHEGDEVVVSQSATKSGESSDSSSSHRPPPPMGM